MTLPTDGCKCISDVEGTACNDRRSLPLTAGVGGAVSSQSPGLEALKILNYRPLKSFLIIFISTFTDSPLDKGHYQNIVKPIAD